MREIEREILTLIERYGDDTKKTLQENSRLEYLYALSDLRENLLEWYPFDINAKLLQVGADFGALTGLFSRKVKSLVVLDQSEQQLAICRRRYRDQSQIEYRNGELADFADCHEVFQYITLLGTLGETAEQQIMLAKRCLAPGGVLILAACNPFGVKYLAGAAKDPYCFTKKEIIQLLGKEEGTTSWYYPMPDYRLPSTIYSQSWLPKKGDLTKPLLAYDYPQYLQLDIGAMFDAVCSDQEFEQFANSFLVFWQKHTMRS